MLNVARAMIAQGGSAGFTIREPGRRATESVTTIYAPYGDKEGLVGAAIQDDDDGLAINRVRHTASLPALHSASDLAREAILANRPLIGWLRAPFRRAMDAVVGGPRGTVEAMMANVLITGANRGIGLELARAYAKAGDRVFAFVRSPGQAEALDNLAAASGGKVTVHAMDVSEGASIAAAHEAVGEVPIDILINNAGVLGGNPQTLQSIDFDAWIDALKIMTIGPFRVVQAFLPNLKKAAAPKVMTVTSQIGASTWPYGGTYAYASAKAGVNKVMQALALDLKGDNITVALVHPGWVKTDMGGANADITPEESASGIHKVIAALGLQDSGKFYKWNGDIHPW